MTAIADRRDASGLNCPRPILRTRKAINRLLSSNETDSRFVYLIAKA